MKGAMLPDLVSAHAVNIIKTNVNKYGVDFFVLYDAHLYFICHIDVYQGRNGANIGIHPDVKHMPTTQKAVANAIICSDVKNDPCGHREVYTDNRYSSIELAIWLQENCQVLTAGTIRRNRKGMDKEMFNMSKKIRYGAIANYSMTVRIM